MYTVAILTLAFLGIVALEQLPGVMTPTADPGELLMYGLFKISLLDDITHGISGLAGLVALLGGYRWQVRYLLLVGGYYALDALFFVVNGALTGQSAVDNVLLNLPHVLIAVLVAFALRSSIRAIELR